MVTNRPERGSNRGRRKPSGPPHEPTQHPTRAAARGSRLDRETKRRATHVPSFERLVADPEWAALVPAIEAASRDAHDVLPKLATYVAAILDWNRRVSNLISRNDESRLVSRHLAESLGPLAALAESGAERWIDLGSGAGLPALPIAIAGVGKKWLLVESRRPKTLFLRRVVQDLGLAQVHVAHSRLEEVLDRAEVGEPDVEVTKAGGFPFDAFTSRAVIPLAPTLELAARALKPGGSAFLWKGSGRQDERAGGDFDGRWIEKPDITLESTPIVVCNLQLVK